MAKVFGIKFSGFLAWWLWRTVYLAKLPRLAKKLRVMVSWTMDLFFGREIEQMVTVRDVEQVTQRLERLRVRMKREAKIARNTDRGQTQSGLALERDAKAEFH